MNSTAGIAFRVVIVFLFAVLLGQIYFRSYRKLEGLTWRQKLQNFFLEQQVLVGVGLYSLITLVISLIFNVLGLTAIAAKLGELPFLGSTLFTLVFIIVLIYVVGYHKKELPGRRSRLQALVNDNGHLFIIAGALVLFMFPAALGVIFESKLINALAAAWTISIIIGVVMYLYAYYGGYQLNFIGQIQEQWRDHLWLPTVITASTLGLMAAIVVEILSS